MKSLTVRGHDHRELLNIVKPCCLFATVLFANGTEFINDDSVYFAQAVSS